MFKYTDVMFINKAEMMFKKKDQINMKDKISSFLQILKRLYYILDRHQLQKSIIVLVVIIIGSFFNIIGISVLLPFIQGVMNLENMSNTWFANIIMQIFHTNNSYYILVIEGILIIGVFFIKNLYLILEAKMQIRFRCNTIKELSIKLFNSYMRRPYSFFLNTNSAEFMRGINDDVAGVFFVLDNLFRLFQTITSAIFMGAFIIYTDTIMAIGILLIAGLCIIGTQFLFGDKIRKLRLELRTANKEQYQAAYQAISGVKDIKVMHRSEYFIKQYEKAYDKKIHADYGYCLIQEVPAKLIELACICGLIFILCVRIGMGVNPAVFIPKLIALALAIFQVMPLISGIANNLNNLSYRKSSLDAVYDNLVEVERYEDKIKSEYNETCENDAIYHFKEKLELKGVSWTYPGSEKQILNEVSLNIQKGESIALIGTSGGGKTTMADIILGLLRPKHGMIFMDGIDVYSIPNAWSKIIGYVPQTVFLLDDTIRNNVTFGLDIADDEMVWNALQEAQLKDYVMSLPDKLNTNVGERGIKFSGGQRQRMAIARALYYNPDILVLDEATSALDGETEKAVMEAIDKLQGNKTLIIIAHRLSTIKNCNKVYEIAGGKAIERENFLSI